MQNQSDKVAEAVPTLLATLRSANIEAGRFTEALRATEESYRGSRANPRFGPFTVDDWLVDGFDGDPRPARFDALSAVTVDALTSTVQALSKRPAIVTIVGDGSTIDLAALERDVGPIVRVKPEQLFTR